MKQLIKFLGLAMVTTAASFFLLSGTSRAASITVNSTLDSQVQDDGDCTLREAIANVVAASDTTDGGGGGDCVAGDGVNDTITVPAGTVNLTADQTAINASVAIHGAGMGQTIIDGMGTWATFSGNTQADNVTITDMKITGFGSSAINFGGTNLTVERVEIDGSNTVANSVSGIINGSDSSDTINPIFRDVYIHDLSTTTAGSSGEGAIGLLSGALGNGNTHATLERVTIAHISSNRLAIGLESFSGFNGLAGIATFDMSNTTISDIASTTDTAAGIIAIGVSQGDSVASSSIVNSTITDTVSQVGQVGDGSGLIVAAGAAQSGAVATSNLSISNTVFANNKSNNVSSNCRVLDVTTTLMAGLGTAVFNLTSTGGNLSDDNSCASYFSAPTDQNNVAGLGASLAALADNGGFVPTMALKEGSAAIDSGITIAGLTTDARGISRPQGTAYDSGAYESPYSKPATPTLAKSGQNTIIAITTSLALIGIGLGLRRKYSYSVR